MTFLTDLAVSQKTQLVLQSKHFDSSHDVKSQDYSDL